MCDQSGSVRAADDAASVGGNNRRSSSASSISSGSGQLRPATAARRTYSPTAVLPIPVASPTKPPAHPHRVRQTQHVTYLPHRHSLRWHRSPPGCQGDRSADSTVDGSALYAAITCCPQSPDCCPPCRGIGVRVAPDSAVGHIRVFAALAALIAAGTLGYTLVVEAWAWIAIRTCIGFCFAGMFALMESWLNAVSTNQNRVRFSACTELSIWQAWRPGNTSCRGSASARQPSRSW